MSILWLCPYLEQISMDRSHMGFSIPFFPSRFRVQFFLLPPSLKTLRMSTTSTQPTPASMVFQIEGYANEKHERFDKRDQYELQEDGCEHSHHECRRACHRKRTRFLAFAFIFSVLALAGVLAVTYFSCGEETMSALGDGLLWKRATAAGNGNNTFVSHKCELVFSVFSYSLIIDLDFHSISHYRLCRPVPLPCCWYHAECLVLSR
jgi:hypothetical protein